MMVDVPGICEDGEPGAPRSIAKPRFQVSQEVPWAPDSFWNLRRKPILSIPAGFSEPLPPLVYHVLPSAHPFLAHLPLHTEAGPSDGFPFLLIPDKEGSPVRSLSLPPDYQMEQCSHTHSLFNLCNEHHQWMLLRALQTSRRTHI